MDFISWHHLNSNIWKLYLTLAQIFVCSNILWTLIFLVSLRMPNTTAHRKFTSSLFWFYASFQKQLIWQQISREKVQTSFGKLRRISTCFVLSMISLNWQKAFPNFSLLANQRRSNLIHPSTSSFPRACYFGSILMPTDSVQGDSCHLYGNQNEYPEIKFADRF